MAASTASLGGTTTTLTSGRPLFLLRLIYGVLVILVLVIFVGNLPYAYGRGLATLGGEQQAIIALGLPPELPAIFDLLLRTVFLSGFMLMSLLLFWQRAADPMAALVSFLLLSTGYLYSVSAPRDHALWLAGVGLNALAETTQVLFVFSFPNGRFVPAWTRRLAIPMFLFRFLIWLNIFVLRTGQGGVEVGIVAAFIVAGIGTQNYRYRRLASPAQRQQLKWLLGSVVVAVTLVVPSIYLMSITDTVSPERNVFLYLAVKTVRDLALLSFPLMIGAAILRYRLWEIDLTINRSLVGVAVTVILGGLFIIGFLALQWVFGRILGRDQRELEVAIAGAMVGIAFNPVRVRVRRFVDRRLYKFRFDLDQLDRAHGIRPKPEVKTPSTLTGKIVGGYEILDLIGRGGMGEVYKGYKEGEIVAVKVLRDDLNQIQPDLFARFQREATVLQNFQHPNIVKVLSADTSAEVPFLVLEYLEGETLGDHLKTKGALPFSEFLPLALTLTEALEYIHARGVVHRDLKPSNIMLRPTTTAVPAAPIPVLMDFGVARGDTLGVTLTGSNAVGTIEYMAPEQIESAHDVDHYADIYALGITFYEMLVGNPPFQGRPAHVLFAHLQQPPPDPRKTRPEIPDPFVYLLRRALAKKPEDRFPSAAELGEYLQDAVS